jgi:hypothetical protein
MGVILSGTVATWLPKIESSYNPVNGKLTLTWSSGNLYESTSVTGPWTASSVQNGVPFTPGGAHKFYKIQ